MFVAPSARSMRTQLATMLGASVLVVSSVARAQDYGNLPQESLEDPSEPPPAAAPLEPSRPTHWYGYETLATDGAALLLSVPALASHASGVQSVFGWGSALTYGLGAPIVHFAHGHVGKGFADLGLRVGMPLVLGVLGGMIGVSTYQPPPCNVSLGGWAGLGCALDDTFGPVGAFAEGAMIGGLLGMGGAMALDAAVLAREPIKHDGVSPRIEPAFGLTPERRGGTRATVGLVGAF
jgi:hypothetical protein